MTTPVEIRMTKQTWTVQVKNEIGQWTDHEVHDRFSQAWRAWDALPDPKRLLHNGNPIRIHTPPDQLDLFQEDQKA